MFRFTLRDLFWLTVVVAVSLGWSASYARYERRLLARGRHAEALRMALENAEQNHVFIREAVAGEQPEAWSSIEDNLLPVDWDLATREIP